jgi:hypothetical protein
MANRLIGVTMRTSGQVNSTFTKHDEVTSDTLVETVRSRTYVANAICLVGLAASQRHQAGVPKR